MLKSRTYPLFWKLALPVLVVTLVWGVIIVITALGLKESQARAQDLYTKNVSYVLQLQALSRKFSVLNHLLLMHVSSADGQQIAELTFDIYDQKVAVAADFELLERVVLADHGQTYAEFAEAHKVFQRFTLISHDIVRLSEDFEKLSAFEMLQQLTSELQHPINEALTKIITSELNILQQSYGHVQGIWQKNFLTLAGAGAAAFLLTLAFLWRIIDSITRRMGLVASCANRLSQGDLSARVEADGFSDEISHLAQDLAVMAEGIDQSTLLLQESEGQVRLLLNSTAEAIYGIDIEGRCTFANQACLEMLGYESADELLGRNMQELIHHSYPDGRPYPTDECPVNRSILSGQDAHNDNDVLWRKDGSKFRAEYRSHPIKKDGEVVGVVISFLDITERMLTAEALRKSHDLLDQSQQVGHIGSWEWDINSKTITWTDETYRIFGYAPQEFVATYDAFMARIHPEDRTAVQHAVQSALDGRQPYDINHRIFLADGSERIVNEKGRVYRDAEDNPEYMIGTVQDITDIVKIEQDLRTYQDELEVLVAERTAELQVAKEEADRANQAKSLFLSSMSHELRTPLNSILGFGQLLVSDRKNPLTPSQQGHLQKVLRSGNHLLSLIDDVLNLSKIEAGVLEISLEPVNVNAVLMDAAELVQEMAKAHNVEIFLEEVDRNCFIDVDNTRFRQVIMNFLSNGIKYNRPGGTVTLACRERDGELRIIVADTGRGIAPDKAALLFEPFSRLGAETSAIEGTGIGLTITKRLVGLMNGRIGYDSEEGKGSRFWVEFPLVSGQSQEDSLIPKNKMTTPLVPEGNHTILYVEDNKYNRELLTAILARTPTLKLLLAENGGQGLDMARQHQPHLILMDIGLPDMDGFATLQKLREQQETASIPVVALSGNAMPQDIEKARQAGFVDYITKPLSIPNLYRVIGEVINGLPKSELE